MDFPLQLALGWLLVSIGMHVAWLRAVRIDKAGIVDVVWTFALGFLAIFYMATLAINISYRQWVVATLVVAWSLRLGIFLYHRVASESEDSRYSSLKKRWGQVSNVKFLIFFQAQALADAALSISFLIAMLNTEPFGRIWDWLAIGVAVMAVLGEGISDQQLKRFKADPNNKGRTCREGLWRYSRHPNYFFEWLYWWAFPLLAVGSEWFWLSLLSPLVMLILILKVTGIPPTEMQAIKRRGDDYRRYQSETSPFIPWFYKNSSNN